MAIPHELLAELLELPDKERGALAALLVRSLEPDDDDAIRQGEWDALWGAEIARRIQEIREGSVELVDGDEVLHELNEIADRR